MSLGIGCPCWFAIGRYAIGLSCGTGQCDGNGCRGDCLPLGTYSGRRFILCAAGEKDLFAMRTTHLPLGEDISHAGKFLAMLATGQQWHRVIAV